MKLRIVLPMALAAVALSGCTSTLKAPEMNAAGRIDTNEEIDPEDIQVAEAFDPAWGRMVVIADFNENETINDFYYQTLVNSGRFENVYNSEGLEEYVLANDIEGVTDTDSLLSMRNLARAEGGFVFIRPYVEWEGGYNYQAAIEAFNAETGRRIFRVEKTAFNWAGLDSVLFYPVMDTLLGWIDGEHPVNTDEIVRDRDEEETEETAEGGDQ